MKGISYLFVFFGFTSSLSTTPHVKTIAAIQGHGHISPHEHEHVTIKGVVTLNRTNGFFVQEEPTDADPKTSHGIYVYVPRHLRTTVYLEDGNQEDFDAWKERDGITVEPGMFVQVHGTVKEFTLWRWSEGSLSLTEIVLDSVEEISASQDDGGCSEDDDWVEWMGTVDGVRIFMSNFNGSETVDRIQDDTRPRIAKKRTSGPNDIKPLRLSDLPTRITFLPNPFFMAPHSVMIPSALPEYNIIPSVRGMDYMESIEGMLITIARPIVTQKPSRNNFWVRDASLPSTSVNKRGGLTLEIEEGSGICDTNPETVKVIGNFKGLNVGDVLEEITGAVTYEYGSYGIVPMPGTWPPQSDSKREKFVPKVVERAAVSVESTYLRSAEPHEFSIAHYNIENCSPLSPPSKFAEIARHVIDGLGAPDLLNLNEVQDDDGPDDTGTVSADKTLGLIVDAIEQHGKVKYRNVYLSPQDHKDGGQPGGNIRNAFLYKSSRVTLAPGTPGDSTTNAKVTGFDDEGYPMLNHNPVRITEPVDAFLRTRKPLLAGFDVTVSLAEDDASGEVEVNKDKELQSIRVYMTSVHLSSKRGSDPMNGSYQPPENGGFTKRRGQAAAVSDVLNTLTPSKINSPSSPGPHKSPNPQQLKPIVVTLGDFNEFHELLVHPFATRTHLTNLIPALLPRTERYSYVYDGNSQEIDHICMSDWAARYVKTGKVVHVNTWWDESETSDHDPMGVVVDVREMVIKEL